MSGKLDQSLDEILTTQRKSLRGRRTRKIVKTTTTAVKAPVGGIKKATRPTRTASKVAATVPSAPQPKESKIIVTGLPHDVNEAQIKEYFAKSVGPVRRVLMTYNQNGRSTGVATIIFAKADSAVKAAKDLNGMLVDKRPMKIEVIVDASHAPAPPVAKSLGERVAYGKRGHPTSAAPLTPTSANPKAQPKSAVPSKGAGEHGSGKKTANKPRKRGRIAKPKKTADELDAEMTTYFATGPGGGGSSGGAMTGVNGAGTNPTAGAGAGGEDLGMDDIS